MTIIPGQHEGVRHLVHLAFKKGEDAVKSACAVTPLVVMVIHKGQG